MDRRPRPLLVFPAGLLVGAAIVYLLGDVTRLRPRSVPAGTAVIRFGPGTFEVPALGFRTGSRDRDAAVPALEIRGAGRDRTTLIGLADFFVSGRVEHLMVRDLTWVAGEGAGSPSACVTTGSSWPIGSPFDAWIFDVRTGALLDHRSSRR